MRIIGAAGAAAVALWLGGGAQAASFDCAKAGTRTEKMICADKALSALDSELALAFRDAVKLSPTPARLTAEQRDWLRGRDQHAEPRYVEDLYRGRLQALNAVRQRDARARWHPRDKLTSECLPLLLEGPCVVTASGPVPGFDPPVFYQAQRAPEDDAEMWSGLVLFEADGPERLKPIVWDGGDGGVEYDFPRLVRTAAGPWLVVEGRMRGSGAYNADIALRRVDGAWRDIDLHSWQGDLQRRLPDGRHVAKGVRYDFQNLTATSPVWTERDANCCPEGGLVEATLGLEGDRLVLRSMSYDPDAMVLE